MRTIFLYRHAKKVGHGDVHLSNEGIESACRVGETQLRGKNFSLFFVSSRNRTKETLSAFRKGAGDFLFVEPKIFPLHTDVFSSEDAMKLWEGVCNEAEQKNEDMLLAALQKDHERTERISFQAGEAFKKWIHTLPNDTNVLVVYHSPALELIVYNLFGITLTQLKPSEGFKINERDDELIFESIKSSANSF
mgnify:CR=1 FL=1